jgi:hypothetical protein
MNILQLAVPLPRFKSRIPPSKGLNIQLQSEAEAAILARRRRSWRNQTAIRINQLTEDVKEDCIGKNLHYSELELGLDEVVVAG